MMLIQLRTHGFDLMGAVHRHLDRRTRASLRSATDVRAVTLSLSDVNGPRGGQDLRCTVTLELAPRGSVRGEAVSSDVMAAVGRALARARSSLRRASSRGRRTRSEAAGGGRSSRAWEARA